MTTQQAVPVSFSGSIPANYDNFLGPLFFEPFALDMAQRLQFLHPARLLEVAAGTGRVTRHLPEVLPEGAKVIATDINPAMVAFGRERLAAHPNIEWDTVDAVALPYGDDAFDCIVSQFGIMFYSDRIQAYREAHRVLQSGGVFLFNAWDHIDRNPAARLTNEVLEQFFPENTPAFYKIPFSCHDANQIRQDLETAGFEIGSMQVLRLTGYAPTAEDAAQGLLEGTPVQTAIMERNAELMPVIKKTLSEDLKALFGEEDLHVPLQARVIMAVKK